MSDGELAGIGIIAGIAAMAVVFLSMFFHPEQKETIMEASEYAEQDVQDGCLKVVVGAGVLVFILFLLFNF